jgi:hypothetical protein
MGKGVRARAKNHERMLRSDEPPPAVVDNIVIDEANVCGIG